MKTATIDGAAAGKNPQPALRFRSRIGADYAELVKARLTMLVLLTTAAGYYLAAPPPIKYLGLLHVVLGTACAAAGAAALNQWWERKVDALMERTKDRPVPAGRMPAAEALAAGAILSIVGIAYLAVTCNTFSAVIAAITVIIYIFAYTPLKRISNFNTLVGTVPGALPPVVGWVAARGRIDPGAWSLFAIMVLWQLPHFFAISWMCREDYSRAGFQMISNDDVRGDRSASQSVFFTMLLLVIAGLPAFVGVASQIYVPIELLLGACYVAVALQFLQKRTIRSARLLFLTSILYLPLLLGALVLTKL
jgi:protoheme IX farnesyltransferase